MMAVKQTIDSPLFPDILWSRPENRNQAGKLLIIGGNLHDIAKIAESATICEKAGAGVVRIVLPDCIKRMVGTRENVFYAPSNPSGGFARKSLDTWLEHAQWADMVLLPGELGRNSESTLVLESFLQKYNGAVTITRDAIDLAPQKKNIIERPKTLLVLAFPQLQKILASKGVMVRLDTPLQQMTEHIQILTKDACVITLLHKHLFVAAHRQVSLTEIDIEHWRLPIACYSAVWLMQFPLKPFEALTSAVFEYQNKKTAG